LELLRAKTSCILGFERLTGLDPLDRKLAPDATACGILTTLANVAGGTTMSRFMAFLVLLAGVLAPGVASAQVQKVLGGFVYTEGPVADGKGNLYFTDPKDGCGKIYRLDDSCRLSVFVENSGRANGLKINALGEIVACQQDGRVVAYRPDGLSCRVLTDCFRGRRYNAPNDLVIDAGGGIYFTDPGFGAPRPLPQRVAAVYYLAPTGEVTRLIDDLHGPNGIALSPDEKTLYVGASLQRHVMAYPIVAPGQVGAGRKFGRLAPSGIPLLPIGDGITVDTAGNVYVATMRGVQIFDPCGRLRDTIRVPERPSNLTFGGPDQRTLFITAGHSLYAAKP
jgi:gluconolactonase